MSEPIPADAEWRDDPWLGVYPFMPELRDDPYPLLARLRRHSPVNETPVGLYRLTRYRDVVRMLKEVPSGVRLADGTIFGNITADDAPGTPGEFLLRQDPPNHTRLRKLMSHAFRPRAVERLRQQVAGLVDRLLDEAAERGSMDLIADFALPVPSTVICEMMGVPLADRASFTDWTAAATHLLAGNLLPEETRARALQGGMALAEYFSALIEDRRKHLGDDILSDLIRAEEEGDHLSPTELLAQSIGLLIAGFETTIGLIGNGTLALLHHPDQLALLRAEPGRIAATVEECLRYDGPIVLTMRVTREATDFGDAVIPADRPVMCLLAGANRDPQVFPEPDRFDITRDGADNLGFGGGAHFCLGAHLARMEAQLAIGGLVQRFSRIERTTDDLLWGASLFRVLAELPVRVAP